ncbi:zinc-binding alcohol dehydrogenase family protein [Asticcacaulis sp. DXS10W]|uniref:Zinc-binding alcohol dehydrogenase family protein n=1 Tax=Asticcacaulis currens TaxID=2984210 RepID=A0ABT5IDF0_9CAUL|nr:zinc-binding alcohol dehydrogenase family protein [Asticcacaulis currens]MDC7694231.1 zinc-binding alcohol dehydrogenase family protein [Asticcacaulis currens]
MQAIAVINFGSDLAAVEAPDPLPGANQVLVRNAACGLNNIDLLIKAGGVIPSETTPLPHILGVEGAGTIEAVGSEVKTFAIGDRVMWLGNIGAGGYGPLTAIDASYVVKIPTNVPFNVAASAPVAYTTARNIIFNYGAPASGDWLLVHSAAGGVGSAILQISRNAGFRTIALTSSAKLDYAKRQGADVAIDRRAPDLIDRIKRTVGVSGIALSLNSVGGDTILHDAEVLGDFGQIVSFGHLGGLPSGSAAELLMPHFGKSIGIRVSDLFTLWRSQKVRFNAILKEISADLGNGVIMPHIDSSFPVARANAAHSRLQSGAAIGKITLQHSLSA